MRSPLILTLLTVFLWSSSAAFTKAINIPGNAILYIIITISTLIGFEAISFFENKRFVIPKVREIFSLKGVISSIAFGAFWILMGLSLKKSSNASVPWAVQYTWPLFATLFFDLVFRTNKHIKNAPVNSRESLKSWLGMLIGFSGIILLYCAGQTKSTSADQLGAFLAFLAGAAFGLYTAYSSTVSKDKHLEFLILSSITGLFLLVPWAIFENSSLSNLSISVIIYSIIFGLTVECLGSYFWTRASRLIHENNSRMSSIASLTLFLPFISMFLLYLLFGEEQILNWGFATGLCMLLAGTALCKQKQD